MTNKSSYSIKEKVNSIKSKVNTQNTMNDFLGQLPQINQSGLAGVAQKELDNIFKIFSDLLNIIVGGQDNVKNLITDFITNELEPIELEVKNVFKQVSLELCSCNVDARLNIPSGVINSLPTEAPYIEQFDFYGLFLKDINDPEQKLSFDENLNTFLKQSIDSQNPTTIWANEDGTQIVKFNFDFEQDRLSITETDSGPSSDWGNNGITITDFMDLYIDTVNIFPKAEIIKQLLDQALNVSKKDPFELDFSEILDLLLKTQGKCNCNVEDDRSKSTFDIGYEDFLDLNQIPKTINNDLVFGPVDYPTPELKSRPKIKESLVNNAELLNSNEFSNGRNAEKKDKINAYIDNLTEAAYNDNVDFNLQTPELKATLDPMAKFDVNLKMLLLLPAVLVMSFFSPKIVVYLSILYKRYYIDEPEKDLWLTKEEYYEFAARFILVILKLLVKKILKKIWEWIKREIIKLLKKILIKILSEKLFGYISQLQSLIQIITALFGYIPPTIPRINFNNCHSILDGLEQLFNIPNIPPGIPLPPGMSFFGAFKSGLSPTQMTQQAVDKMSSLGLDTQPMPDGTPNPNVLIANAMSTAVISQIQQNARIQVDTIPLYGTGGASIT